MKNLLFIAAFAVFALVLPARSHAQELTIPSQWLLPHYRLAVSFNTTTVLVFPAAVKPVDRGARDIIAQRQPGADNVLKLKAARKGFAPTNLHVFTADGAIYAFNIYYSDSLAATYEFHRLENQGATVAVAPLTILLTDQPVNSAIMEAMLSTVRNNAPFLSRSIRKYRLRLRLLSIDETDHILFFRFSIRNRSNLDYTPDFSRLYISDRRKVKRTSEQDHEIEPLYKDSLATVPGHATIDYIVAVPQFTIPDGKQFRIELFEKNGGRNLSLQIRNKYLLRSRNF